MLDVILKRFELPDELREGALFHVPAEPHDSWVVGDVTYVSLHFLGAEQYARR